MSGFCPLKGALWMVGATLADVVLTVILVTFALTMKTQQMVSLVVDGMKCGGCQSQVTQTLENVAGVESVAVDLQEKLATVRGEKLDAAALVAAVESAGFRAAGFRAQTVR